MPRLASSSASSGRTKEDTFNVAHHIWGGSGTPVGYGPSAGGESADVHRPIVSFQPYVEQAKLEARLAKDQEPSAQSQSQSSSVATPLNESSVILRSGGGGQQQNRGAHSFGEFVNRATDGSPTSREVEALNALGHSINSTSDRWSDTEVDSSNNVSGNVETFHQNLEAKPEATVNEFWSKGSEAHDEGSCRPCHYVHTSGGCKSGVDCAFCHIPHPKKGNQSRPCKSKRKHFQRYNELIGVRREDGAVTPQETFLDSARSSRPQSVTEEVPPANRSFNGQENQSPVSPSRPKILVSL